VNQFRWPSHHMPLLAIYWPPVVVIIWDSVEDFSLCRSLCLWCMRDTSDHWALQAGERSVQPAWNQRIWKPVSDPLQQHVMLLWLNLLYQRGFSVLYDTSDAFNMDWKAHCGQLNLAHITRNKNESLNNSIVTML